MIHMTCPTLRPHGGVRVILEWARRLGAVVHVPRVEPVEWMDASGITITDSQTVNGCSLLIVGSPHGLPFLDQPAERKIVFLQMAEHMFRRDAKWTAVCARAYTTSHPLVLISGWNERVVREFGRTGHVVQVGNGVSLDDFPIEPTQGATVLVEGWNPTNPTKDVRRVAPRVAARLKADGFRIVAYAARPPWDHHDVPHEFHVAPDRETLNALYRGAAILLKASRYDARACAPMEAMTKGTPTVRAIIEGDDDLTAANSVRTRYSVSDTYEAARALLSDDTRLSALSDACVSYAESHSWDRMWPSIAEALR